MISNLRRLALASVALAAFVTGCGVVPRTDTSIASQQIAAADRYELRPVATDSAGEAIPPAGDDTPNESPPREPWPDLVGAVDFNTLADRALQEITASPVYAVDGIDTLTYRTMLNATLARNPAIRAARVRVDAIEAELGELEALRLALGTYAGLVEQLDPRVRRSMPPRTGPESYPLPGADGLRSAVVEQAVRIANQQYVDTLRRVLYEARVAYHENVFLRTRAAILDEKLSLVRTLREAVQARFRTGAASLAELLALDAEVATIENERDDVDRAIERSHATVATLLDLRVDTPIGRLTPPAPWRGAAVDVDVDAAARARLRANPMHRTLALQRDRMGLMIEMIEVMSMRDLDFGTSAVPRPFAWDPMRRSPMRAEADATFGVVEAYRREMLVRQAALEFARAATLNDLSAQLATALQYLHDAQAELALQSETLRDLTDRAARVAIEAYSTGAVTFDRALDAIRATLRNRLDEAAAHRRLADAVAALERLLGPVNQ